MYQITIVDEKGGEQEVTAENFVLITKSKTQISQILGPDESTMAFGLMDHARTVLEAGIIKQVISKK